MAFCTCIITNIITNEIFLSCLLAIVAIQAIKMGIEALYHKKKISIGSILNTGGMPSSHSGVVAALTTSVLYMEGGPTTLVYVCFFLSGVVMRDAFGLRWDVGQQARALNILAADSHNKKLKGVKLNENVGHTFLQVLVGMAIGIIISVAVHQLLI